MLIQTSEGHPGHLAVQSPKSVIFEEMLLSTPFFLIEPFL